MRDFISNNLRAINSATKYPSIPTYHTMGEKGILQSSSLSFGDNVYVTEKVDGTSVRIILLPNEGTYLLGSREELLYCNGDVVHNPALDIVDNLKPIADQLCVNKLFNPVRDKITVIFLEQFGNRGVGNYKAYSKSGKNAGFRVFDICEVGYDVLSKPIEKIASWRDNGGQNFYRFGTLLPVCDILSLQQVPLIKVVDRLPVCIQGTFDFLQSCISSSLVKLEDEATGIPEGVVIRNADRTKIAKIRFEDYKRTLTNK